ncbi:MAG: amidohydrolase family protein, partial [Burkholderiales bacterium]
AMQGQQIHLKQFYFESLIFTPAALRHLARQVGIRQIVMGTDYPFPWEDKAVDRIINTPGLTDDEKIAMLGGTAQKLLNIR